MTKMTKELREALSVLKGSRTKLEEFLSELHIHKIDPFMLSVLCSKSTGVEGTAIYVVSGAFEGNFPLWKTPRMYVALGKTLKEAAHSKTTIVTLADPPMVLGELPSEAKVQAIKFVNLNRSVLLRYWSQDICSMEMVNSIMRIEGVGCGE